MVARAVVQERMRRLSRRSSGRFFSRCPCIRRRMSSSASMALERCFGRPDRSKLAPERRFGRPSRAKLALEQRFCHSGETKLTLERHVGGSSGGKLALEQQFGRHMASSWPWNGVLGALAAEGGALELRFGRPGSCKLALEWRFGRPWRKVGLGSATLKKQCRAEKLTSGEIEGAREGP